MGYGQYSNHPFAPRSSRERRPHLAGYRECVSAWLSGNDSGKAGGGRMYFNGATLYSYGSHFPMARIVSEGAGCLVNSSSDSPTTNKHMSIVRQLVSGAFDSKRVFYLPTRALKAYDDRDAQHGFDQAIEHYVAEARSSFEKSITARKKREEHLESGMWHLAEANRFAEFYGMPSLFTINDLHAAKLAVALDGSAEALIAINAAISARAKAMNTRREKFATILTGESA